MATFLVTAKMSPELAARIEASVGGGRGRRQGAVLAPRQVLLLRLGIAVLVISLASSFVVFRRRGQAQLEQARAALVDGARVRGGSLSADETQAVARAESWLLRSSGAYEGDFVDDALRGPAAFEGVLARPTIYVRGPLGAFRSSREIAEGAATSAKDAFVLCLLEPPVSTSEKALLGKVRIAYSDGAALERTTSTVHRLYAAEVSLPLLMPSWTQRVAEAREVWELARLRKELDKAPIEEGKKALSAGLLLFVMDEPGDGPGPTEIDGERAHEIRVGLVDLRLARVLLRVREHADPSWISAATRPQYASGLDGCRLALDVRQTVAPSTARARATDSR